MIHEVKMYGSSNNLTTLHTWNNEYDLYNWRETNYKNKQLHKYECCFEDFFTTHINKIFPSKYNIAKSIQLKVLWYILFVRSETPILFIFGLI